MKRPGRPCAAVVALSAGLLTGAGGGVRAQASVWDPGPASLVYTARVEGNSELLLRVEGTDTNLSNDPGQDHMATWSPDGSRLAFQTSRDGNREIYVMSADGSEPRNLSRHPAQDLLPRYSPDGRIMFFSDRDVPDHPPDRLPGHLFVMDADGGNVQRLTDDVLTSTFAGSWSPDARHVLFARDYDGNVDLVLLDVTTRAETRLPGDARAEYGGAWSPDGGQIAYHAVSGDGESRLVVANADGTGRREVTAGAQHYNPTWSPDGSWLLFTGAPLGASQFDLLRVSASGGEVLPVVASERDERAGVWRPR